MKWKQPLTEEQRTLAGRNLHLVRWTVREYINVRDEIEGLGLEDLCQEGAIALCHAAATYQAGPVQFKGTSDLSRTTTKAPNMVS